MKNSPSLSFPFCLSLPATKSLSVSPRVPLSSLPNRVRPPERGPPPVAVPSAVLLEAGLSNEQPPPPLYGRRKSRAREVLKDPRNGI